jgi:ribonuclease HII
MLILGIDDAGRGPLIGPMFLAGVLIDKKDYEILKKQGVNDSKQVLHPKRVLLSKLIKDSAVDFYIARSDPDQIDNAVNSGLNLNTLEAMKTAEIINKILINKKEKIQIVVDCPSTNISAWRNKVLEYVTVKVDFDLICEHKADANHVAVSAASILAKVAREDAVAEIKERLKQYGDVGSGYPADPFTKEFLKKYGNELKDSGIFRKSWSTWKSLFPEAKQSTLKGF